MDFHSPSDSSGTDDDLAPNLPPNHSNTSRMTRGGRPSGNGRAAAASSYGRPQQLGGAALAEQQTRRLEMEAYTAVLRAFAAQSENISWGKDLLMSELRKELRVPDEQHRELIIKITVERDILQIREWRKMEPTPDPNTPVALLEPSPSPAVSQSRKKAKPAHSAAATPVLPTPPPPLLKPAPLSTPSAPSPAVSKRNVPVGPRGKKSKGGRIPQPISISTPKLLTGPPSSRGSSLGRGPPPTRTGLGSETPGENHIGRKVKTRWPEDNAFYEAVVTEYDQDKGLHALVYDMGTAQETWEWVNLKEMDRSDMTWVDAAPISVPNRGASAGAPSGRGSGRGSKRGSGGRGASMSGVGRARGAGRGQGAASTPAVVPIAQTRSWRGSSGNENGLERKNSRTLQVPVVDPLLKEAENLKEITDLERLESMKRKAKAQGDALRTALAELGESSEDGGSDGDHGPSQMRLGGNRSLQGSRDRRDETDDEEDTAGDGRGDGSDGELLVGDGGGSDAEHHMADEGDEDDDDG